MCEPKCLGIEKKIGENKYMPDCRVCVPRKYWSAVNQISHAKNFCQSFGFHLILRTFAADFVISGRTCSLRILRLVLTFLIFE